MGLPKANLLFLAGASSISERNPLTSGTWYTPSATRPCSVVLYLGGTGITGGEDIQFSVELRDLSDVAVVGFPMVVEYVRGAGAVGNNDLHGPFGLLVPAGYDYRVVNNSTGATASTLRAVETLL